MAEYILIKNGRKIVARSDTAEEMRDLALDLIAKSPRAAFEACRVVKRVKGTYTPPAWGVEEEDV